MSKVIPLEIKEKWVEEYKSGSNPYVLSNKYKVAYSTIYGYLSRTGVLRRKNLTITTKIIKEWIELYESGDYNMKFIARLYGVSANTLAKYLHKFGVKTSRYVYHNCELRRDHKTQLMSL